MTYLKESETILYRWVFLAVTGNQSFGEKNLANVKDFKEFILQLSFPDSQFRLNPSVKLMQRINFSSEIPHSFEFSLNLNLIHPCHLKRPVM